jgi:hypothetical protein
MRKSLLLMLARWEFLFQALVQLRLRFATAKRLLPRSLKRCKVLMHALDWIARFASVKSTHKGLS